MGFTQPQFQRVFKKGGSWLCCTVKIIHDVAGNNHFRDEQHRQIFAVGILEKQTVKVTKLKEKVQKLKKKKKMEKEGKESGEENDEDDDQKEEGEEAGSEDEEKDSNDVKKGGEKDKEKNKKFEKIAYRPYTIFAFERRKVLILGKSNLLYQKQAAAVDIDILSNCSKNVEKNP